MSYNGDLDIVRKKAESQGWRYQKTSNGHHQFYSPDKVSIVTTSGTPGDQRGWQNFLAEMRRGGYKDEPGPIGVAIMKARNEETNLGIIAAPKYEGTTSGLVKDFLRDNPSSVFNIDRVSLHVLAKKPDATKLAIQQALTVMAAKGEVKRVGRGEYQWASTGAKPAEVQPAQPAAGPVEVLQKAGSVMGQFTGDPVIDADLAMLDQALVALGQIEEVVSRNRERLFALAQFKKLLGG